MQTKHLMSFGSAERLSQFPEYRFFTPALLYLYSRHTEQLLQQFADEHTGCCYYHHHFKQPLFRGFSAPNGDLAWNFVLWAMDKPFYPAFERFMLSTVMVDRVMQRVYRIGVDDINIVDPLYTDRQQVLRPSLPRLSITVYGVDGSGAAVAVETSTNQPPTLKIYPPQPRTVAFAKSVLRGNNAAVMPVLQNAGTLPAAGQQDAADAIEQYKRATKNVRGG